MLLINSIRSHRQRDRLMERYYDVALAPRLSSLLSPFLLASLLYLFFHRVRSIQLFPSRSFPDRSAEEEQSPKNKIRKKGKYKINLLLTGNLLFLCISFFSWSVTPYPFLHCRKECVSIPARVLCQSDRGKLPSACMGKRACQCVHERERERGRVRLSLCLALLWVSELRLF